MSREPLPTLLRRLLAKFFGSLLAASLAWVLLGFGLLLITLRISMAFAPFFEERADEWLNERFDARLFGLRGGWHGFTPQLRIESILFRRGSVDDIRVDIDLLGSLLAGSPRVDGLSFEHAAIEFPSDFDLIGLLVNPNNQFDLIAMVRDASLFAGSVELRVGEDSEGLVLTWHLQSGSENKGGIWLAPQGRDGGDGGDGIAVGYDLDQGLLSRRFTGTIWSMGQLTIPDSFTSLLGVSGTISAFDTRIQMANGRLSAIGEVRAQSLRVGNYLIDNAELLAKGKGTPWLVQGELERATLERGEQALDLSGTLFSYDENQRWRFNVPDQLIQQVTSFVAASGRDDTLMVRWSKRLAPTGILSEIAGEKTKGSPLVLSARIEQLSAESFMGSPVLEQVDAQMVFASGSARVLLDSDSPTFGLPKLFDQSIGLGRTSGEVWVRFVPRYFGMRGIDLRSVFPDGGEVAVNLSYSGPVDPDERQVAARLEGAGIAAVDSFRLLPKLLPENMKNWLRQAIREGVIDGGEILLSGYVRRQPPLPTMQVEMWLDWLDGVIAFHPGWPEARAVAGRVELIGRMIHGQVEQAELLGAPITDLRFELPMNGPRVSLSNSGRISASTLLELIETTPIASFVPLNLATLDAKGDVHYSLSTSLPLAFRPSDIDLEADLRLDAVDVRLPRGERSSAELTVSQLAGELSYRFPDDFSGQGIQGYLFGHPASLSVSTGESAFGQIRRIQAEVRSSIDHEFLKAALDRKLPIVGESDYVALIEIDPVGQSSPRIRVHSELFGMGVEVPGGLGKVADEAVPLLIDLAVGKEGRSGEAWFSFQERAGGVLSWNANAHSEQPALGGAIIIGPDHSSVEVEPSGGSRENTLQILGGLPEFTLNELRGFDASSTELPASNVSFRDFELGRFQIGQFFLEDISIEGLFGRDVIDLRFTGEHLEGTWRAEEGGYPQLDFARIHLQGGGSDEAAVGGLIGDLDLTSLPEADLSADSLKIAENEYGAWTLGLRRFEDGVRFVNIQAESRGLSIRAADDLVWRQLSDGAHETRFVGHLATDDLADAMTKWGFAPSVEAEHAELAADLSWAGVPWQPELEVLNGEMDLTIRRGRFRDFDSGAGMRLLGLLDFNAFISRIALDFSDVFGEGVAFDEVRVKSQFDGGMMTMLEPAKIDGNGGRFRISGSINLETQELDNELEATLKISRSLPWLATYLALLGNPLTGLSVVVAERVLRERIEDVSTARYYVTGTLSEPEFSLTEVEEPEPIPEELLNPEPPDVDTESIGDGENERPEADAADFTPISPVEEAAQNEVTTIKQQEHSGNQ